MGGTKTLFVALVGSFHLLAQPYTIATFAGGGLPVNVAGTAASLGHVGAAAVDQAGNLFIVSSDYNAVFRMDAGTQMVTLFAGNGTAGFSGDGGPAIHAQFAAPPGIAVDPSGNLYIADTANNRIRKVSGGVITTVVGTGAAGFAGDGGPAAAAILNGPTGLSFDASGNLYFSDTKNYRVRKVSNGIITTVAGNGTPGFNGEGGPALSAQLNAPRATTVDSAGNFYFVDTSPGYELGVFSRILKVSNGIMTSAVTGSFGALNTTFNLAADAAGNVYIGDSTFFGVLKLSSFNLVTAVAGNGTSGFSGDGGSATSAQLGPVAGVAADAAGNLYIADGNNQRIRRVANGVITTVAGNGTVRFGGDGGLATSALLQGPNGIAVDGAGAIYLTANNRVRKIANGVITTVAGNGTATFAGDGGPATSAQVSPQAVAVDAAGNLFIADGANNRVREVSNGIITTVAGNGTAGFSGDGGPAAAASLKGPLGVAVDATGNLYIADTQNFRIRKVSNGVITTFAGGGTTLGDNGPPTSAQLNEPSDVAVDSAGNVFIADQGNGRVREVSNGIITTVAGSGTASPLGDGGPATSAQIFPFRITVDRAGNLYMSDHARVRQVSNGVINTIAGDGTYGFSGDGGPAANAQLNGPAGLAVDAAGNVYVADSGNNRIRVLTPASGSPAPVINSSGVVNGASFAAGEPLVPGSVATAFGTFPENGLTLAQGVPLPLTLAGLSLNVAGTLQGPLFAITGRQVNFQVPWELAGQSQVTLAATVSGQTSALQTMSLAPYAPGIFTVQDGGIQVGAIVDNATGLLVDTTHPAIAGTTVVQIYCTGLGAVNNQPATGAPAVSNPLSHTAITPTVTIGYDPTNNGAPAPAQVLYSGLAPGLVGVYQVNVLVPPVLQCGGLCFSTPVTLTIGGAVSNTVYIAVM